MNVQSCWIVKTKHKLKTGLTVMSMYAITLFLLENKEMGGSSRLVYITVLLLSFYRITSL